MTKRTTKGAGQTRGKTQLRPNQHAALCAVCKHVEREEIERRYLDYETCAKLAEDFGLSDDSISRHGLYFGLDEQRAGDTEKVLKSLIARGFAQVTKIDGKLLIEAVKELNRQTGQRQEERKNQHDLTPKQKQKLETIRRRRSTVQQTESANN